MTFVIRFKLLASLLFFFQLTASVEIKNTPLINAPLENCPTEAVTRLGCILFYDNRLSQNGEISCSSCHRPELAFTDGKSLAKGVYGKTGTRNTPSLLNAGYVQAKFWDGRRASLSNQIFDPFLSPNEHGLKDRAELVRKFQAAPGYEIPFQQAFGKPKSQATDADLAQALSGYVSSIKPRQTRLGHYLFEHHLDALSPSERQGLELFKGRAQCAQCHLINEKTASLTDGDYHNRGIGLQRIMPRLAKLVKSIAKMPLEERERRITEDNDIAALGRFTITLQPADIGKFKTPSLHAAVMTAPYMHDGSLPTLESAMNWELYYQGARSGQPIVLSRFEKENLLAFLKVLGAQ